MQRRVGVRFGTRARSEHASEPTNRLVLAAPDGTQHHYDKIHPFRYSGEHEHYAAGASFLTVDIEGLRVSFFVCYDLRFADEFWALRRATDCYVVVANWPESRRAHWRAAGMSTVYDRVGVRTLNDALAERVGDHPDREFLVFETADGEVTSWTYAHFDVRCDEFARGLAGLGVAKADRVVLRMSMGVDLVAAWFGCLRVGAIAVPAPLAQTHDESIWMTAWVEPKLVIADPEWADMYSASVTAPEVLAAQTDYVAPPTAPDDVAEIIFTSGSTALPKGVMITHANLLHSGERQSSMRALDAGERCLTALPWFHVNCQSVTVLAALAVGGTAILLERYSARRFMDQVRRHRATQVTLGAMLVRTLLSQPPSDVDAQHVVRRAFYGLADQRPGEAGIRAAVRDDAAQRLRPQRSCRGSIRRAGLRPEALAVPRATGPGQSCAPDR